jgi:glycosyltransferase involved in cell wall biosynthesis
MCPRKVSILIPTKNRKKLLRTALLSVINQTYKNLEIIVNDNNSNDGTHEFIADLLEDERVAFYREDLDLSMTENWSSGFSKVTGDLFVRLDDDNVFASDFVWNCLLAIDEYELDAITFSSLSLTKDGPSKFFEESDFIYKLDYTTSLFLEFHCLTDSNFSMYQLNLLREVIHDNPYSKTALPDRYLNYKLAEANTNKKYKIGFSTKILGITRFDHKGSINKEFFIFNYKEFYTDNFTAALMDCYFNFQMHRAYCAYIFLKSCKDSSIQEFFKIYLLDKKLMKSYAMFGHINQWKYFPTLKELRLSYRMFFSCLIEALRHPFSRVHNKMSIVYIFYDIRRFALLTISSIISFIKIKKIVNSECSYDVNKGDKFCDNFVVGGACSLVIHSLFGDFHKYVDRKNPKNLMELLGSISKIKNARP